MSKNLMNYIGENYSERAEREKRQKNRLLKVREQSKEIAKKVRDNVRIAKQEELLKIQKIKEKELAEWKRRRQCQIENQIDCGLKDFANAHIAAIDASCEENEVLREEREEQDLMAACRGRVAMLQEQRKRDKEAEERLLKKKRKHQKTIGIQADFLTQRGFSEKVAQKDIHVNLIDDSEEEEEIPRYTSKPNIHKHHNIDNNHSANSIDSSNNDDNAPEEIESDHEPVFNQITNLLKQRMQEIYDAPTKKINQAQQPVETLSSSTHSSDVEIVTKSPPKAKKSPTKKGILKGNKSVKKVPSPIKKVKNNTVRYTDYTRNLQQKTYVPPKDLVTRNDGTVPIRNAREEAEIENQGIQTKIDDNLLRQLNEIRSFEAMEKAKLRRDYERLQFEMEELSKQEQELRLKTNQRPSSRDQLLRKEETRQRKMNEAVENALKKNIITCPPVARSGENFNSQGSDVNVANPRNEVKNPEINNLVKIEKLKDLLEQINHQKRLILNELEKGDEVPGPDLERVMECLKKLEKEKATLDEENKEKLKKFDELSERERKVREREIRLESKLRELFKKQQEKESSSSTTSTDGSSSSSGQKIIIAPPVKIIIQPTKSPRKRSKKSIRCLDTLSKEPGKIYPKTPIKQKSKEAPKEPSLSTQPISEQTRSILKKNSPKNDDSSSTSYRSLPEPVISQNNVKPHHKLNPALLHNITRLLGMRPNIGSQLNVDVSSVTTPGSSTINTSGNNSAIILEPAFDGNRMEKLQRFIDDNYSFLNEVNETLDNFEQEQLNDQVIEGIWRDVLNKKKKPQSVTSSVRATERDKNGTRNVIPVQSKTQLTQPKVPPPNSQSTHSRAPPPPTHSRAPPPPTHSKQLESDALKDYAEYTAICQQKIAELNRKMEQVRQEKLKLIENSLSSGEFNNFTEYREIQQQHNQNDGKATSSEPKDSPSQKEDPPSEEINNILQKQTRPFGVSKDSGLSMSRPLTSSDYRDSPDVRVTSEEANVFQPILKVPKVRLITPDGENETIKDVSQLIKKSQRPPLSLKSFSPQIEKQHEPHELSTIAEIDTPTGNRDIFGNVGNIPSFPNFEAYAKDKDIGEHHLTIEQTLPDLGDLKDALPNVNIETFVDPRNFNLEEISKDDEIASNNSSLIDIQEELKRRKIFEKSFHLSDEETPETSIKITQLPSSPHKQQGKSRLLVRVDQTDIEIVQTPKTHRKVQKPLSPGSSNDTLSGIQEIQKDQQDAGMSWSAKLLQQSQEAKDKIIETNFDGQTSSSSSDPPPLPTGRPLSLKDFLRREFLSKSKNDKYLSDDTSVSSQFMRSLLNASSGSTSSERPKSDSSQNAPLRRTSTPVDTKSSDRLMTVTGKTIGGSSKQLFGIPTADSVSTVRDSPMTSGSDKSADKN